MTSLKIPNILFKTSGALYQDAGKKTYTGQKNQNA
jgi:hypothetical protein